MMEPPLKIYVSSKTGSQRRSHTSERFKTLQHAMHVAQSGDTLVIAPGIYEPNLDKRIDAARAAGITLTVAGSED
jgi:hypothetical protein